MDDFRNICFGMTITTYEQVMNAVHSHQAPLLVYLYWLGRFTYVCTSVCWCAVGLMAFDRSQTQY